MLPFHFIWFLLFVLLGERSCNDIFCLCVFYLTLDLYLIEVLELTKILNSSREIALA